jgi:A/G-specific adenine glycosylase
MNKINHSQKSFSSLILNWFDISGRHDLPWQHNKTPYRVWVSEIMLQQTQVSTVIPYYLRFMECFPTLETLATASEDEVLHYWTGLGYYSRARNLQRAAKYIIERFAGVFPDNLNDLISLPGIGRSTAGAILSIAFQKKATLLDGNVKRVLTRFAGINEWPGEKKTEAQLWELAENFTPEKRTADYSQAIMDLGATLCKRSKPQCSACPLQKKCVANAENLQAVLPRSKPRKILPLRKTTLIIFQHKDTIFLEKRASQGIWGGLWSLPAVNNPQEIQHQFAHLFHFDEKNITPLANFRHTFSHFHLEVTPIKILVSKIKPKVMASDQQIWYNLSQPAMIGLPGPIKKLLRAL